MLVDGKAFPVPGLGVTAPHQPAMPIQPRVHHEKGMETMPLGQLAPLGTVDPCLWRAGFGTERGGGGWACFLARTATKVFIPEGRLGMLAPSGFHEKHQLHRQPVG